MQTGTTSEFRKPDWAPLERALSAQFGVNAVDAIRAFWFIGFADGPADIGELRLYEHSQSRTRLALDAEGSAYCWFPEFEGYSRCSLEDALAGRC